MAEVTFVLTRTPREEFFFVSGARSNSNVEESGLNEEEIQRQYRKSTTRLDQPADVKHISGRWGTLGLIKGPKITSAKFAEVPRAGTAAAQRGPTDGIQTIQFADQTLTLTTDGQAIESIKEYTTIERFRNDFGQFGFISLHPATETPYRIYIESGYDLLIQMRPRNNNGEYVRIMDNLTPDDVRRLSSTQQEILKKERAILIHEAVDVTWLVGCISPRPKGNHATFDREDPNNPSAKMMRELFAALNAAPQRMGSMFVLDG